MRMTYGKSPEFVAPSEWESTEFPVELSGDYFVMVNGELRPDAADPDGYFDYAYLTADYLQSDGTLDADRIGEAANRVVESWGAEFVTMQIADGENYEDEEYSFGVHLATNIPSVEFLAHFTARLAD